MRPRSIIGAPPPVVFPIIPRTQQKGKRLRGWGSVPARFSRVAGYVNRICPGGHKGPPLREVGRYSEPTKIGVKGRATGRDGARPLQGIGAGLWRRGAPRVWLPPVKFRNGIWGVSHGHPALRKQRWWCAVKGRCGHRPLRRDGEVSATTRASGAQRSGCASGWEDGVGIGAGIIPKGASNAGQSLRHGCAVTAPFAQGSLGDGDADCRVGPLDLLAMTTAFCHSEERSDVGIRLFYDGRGFGQPGSSAPAEAAQAVRSNTGRSPPSTFPVTNSGNRGMLGADRTLGGAYAAADAGL